MSRFQPRDPAYATRVAEAYEGESASARWGGKLSAVTPGAVEISLMLPEDPASAPGATHRSIVAALLDDACVLAAMTLASAGDSVTTAEYKLNFPEPGMSETLVVRAEVVRPGRSISVCRAEATGDGQLLGKMLATLAVSR